MTRENAIDFLHDTTITSIGKLAHGYVVYENTAIIAIKKVAEHYEQRIKELEEPKSCIGCVSEFLPKGRCESDCYECSRNFNDCYELKK